MTNEVFWLYLFTTPAALTGTQTERRVRGRGGDLGELK